MVLKSRSSRGSAENIINGGASKRNSEMEASVNGASTPEALEDNSIGNKSRNRLSTMKKAAEEQRRKVRETRFVNT